MLLVISFVPILAVVNDACQEFNQSESLKSLPFSSPSMQMRKEGKVIWRNLFQHFSEISGGKPSILLTLVGETLGRCRNFLYCGPFPWKP